MGSKIPLSSTHGLIDVEGKINLFSTTWKNIDGIPVGLELFGYMNDTEFMITAGSDGYYVNKFKFRSIREITSLITNPTVDPLRFWKTKQNIYLEDIIKNRNHYGKEKETYT